MKFNPTEVPADYENCTVFLFLNMRNITPTEIHRQLPVIKDEMVRRLVCLIPAGEFSELLNSF